MARLTKEITMTNYSIDDGHGNAITAGLSHQAVRAVAQRLANERGAAVLVYADDDSESYTVDPSPSAQLIALSIAEDRTVTEYPSSKEVAESLLRDLGAECADDCSPLDHHSGEGNDEPEASGHYDIWGETNGSRWRVEVVFGEIE